MLPKELMARLGEARILEGHQIGPLTRVIGRRLTYAGGDETVVDSTLDGYWDISEKIPAGSVFKFAVALGRTAFAGGSNTTAFLLVGVSGDTDRFSPATDDKDLFSTGVKVIDFKDPADAGDGSSEIAAELTIRVTVTVDNDFTTITAGAFDIFVVYETVPVLACE